jgi:hypothetical protein
VAQTNLTPVADAKGLVSKNAKKIKKGDPTSDLLDRAALQLDQAATVINRANPSIDSAQAKISDANTRMHTYQTLRFNASSANAQIASAGLALNGFLSQTDGLLSTSVGALFDGVRSFLTNTLSNVSTVTWPSGATLDALRTSVESAQPQLLATIATFTAFQTGQERDLTGARDALTITSESLRIAISKSDPAVKQAVELVRTQIAARIRELESQRSEMIRIASTLDSASKQGPVILSGIAELDTNSKLYTDFRAAQDGLLQWQRRLQSTLDVWDDSEDEDHAFELRLVASCAFSLGRTKTTAIQLVKVDKAPGAGGSTTIPLVTVECTSPFSVSAGVEFSTQGEREFSIQSVATVTNPPATQNLFVSTVHSGVHPLPIGAINVRLYEPGDLFAVHGTFGMSGNFRSQSQGGSNAEFLAGPSISFFRTAFITMGVHIGEKVRLIGATEGQPAPTGLNQPPLQKSYKPSFGIAITFTKP